MKHMLELQKQLMPDLMDVMKKRYTILDHIRVTGLVGRRTLASSLGMTERVLRSEIEFLKAQGLLEVNSIGTRIADSGLQLLAQMEPFIKELLGLPDLEEHIRQRFGLKQVTIVPGDADISLHTKKELGRSGAAALRKYVSKDDVIAVTGGSTMAEVADRLTASAHMKGNRFVPARGGLGESVELQANTIASTMAKRTGGQYRLLHVPHHLSEEAYQSLIQEPNIQEIIELISHARIVVHGIGDAVTMATRRGVDMQTIHHLTSGGALAEAFGYYFDQDGRVVHKMPTVGLRLEDIQRTEVVIAVAGGKSKGKAIEAIMKFGHEDVLVTDEAAALQMVETNQAANPE